MKGKLESNIDKNFKRSSDLNKKRVYLHPDIHFKSIFKNAVIITLEDITNYWNPSFKITDSKRWNENLEKVVKTNNIDRNILGIDDYFKIGPYKSDVIQFNKLMILNSFLRQGVI
jgi:hypothetical protein